MARPPLRGSLNRCADLARTLKPKLVIVDLDAQCSPIELINKIKSDPQLKAIKTSACPAHQSSDRRRAGRG